MKNAKTARRRSREAALQALYAWQLAGGDALEKLNALDEDARADVALAQSIVRGVFERSGELERMIAPCLDREFRRLSPVERAILYIGAYELSAHPETPFKVVVNEAIELGKSFGGEGGHKFVNGVLEKLAGILRPQEAGYLSKVERGLEPVTEAVADAYAQALGVGALDMERRKFMEGGIALLAETLRQAVSSPLSQDSKIDSWEATADHYGRAYMTTAATELHLRLSGDLFALSTVIEKADSPAIRSIAGRLAIINGMTLASAGDPLGAIRWYGTAKDYADTSGDRHAMVWARGRGAFTMGYEGADVGHVLHISQEALELSPKASLGRMEAHLAQSHAYARLGNKNEAVAALWAAEDVFAKIASSDLGTVYTMPEWRWHMNSSLTYSRLGMVEKATEAQDHAALLTPGQFRRFSTHIELHRAILTRDAAYATRAIESLPVEHRSLSVKLLAQEAGYGGTRSNDAGTD